MTPSDKLRKIVRIRFLELFERNPSREEAKWIKNIASDLTALISEGYVEKAKYDEAVRQRDELREALEEQKRLYFNLFDEDVSCMYCEVKLKRGSAIILCKECAENTEV